MQLTHQYFSLVKRMNLGELLDTAGWLAHGHEEVQNGEEKHRYIYTCVYIYLFTLFLLPVKASYTDTWYESQNSHETDFNCRLQNQACFSF